MHTILMKIYLKYQGKNKYRLFNHDHKIHFKKTFERKCFITQT